VVVGGGFSDLDLEHVGRLGRRYGTALVVAFAPAPHDPTTPTLAPPVLRLIEIGTDTSFPEAWALAQRRPRTGARTAVGGSRR
jgi:hypothetical protein